MAELMRYWVRQSLLTLTSRLNHLNLEICRLVESNHPKAPYESAPIAALANRLKWCLCCGHLLRCLPVRVVPL